ncbi:MAG: PDZ domain-containing protein [Myxococcota bacterium]
MATPSRAQLRSFAMFGGLMIGIGLLSLMRPGANRVRPVERVNPVTNPAVEAPPARERPVRRVRRRAEPPAAPDAPEADEAPEPDPEPPVEVGVEVRDARGRRVADAWVEPVDCPGMSGLAPQGFFAPPGPCIVRAARKDGLLVARGVPVTLDIRPGTDVSFDVPMDEPPRGGVGVQFRGTTEGMRVDSVLPDTPADRAGLEPGDLIVEVEGESVTAMGIEEFVERITGPEGTDVEFTLQYTTDTGTTQQRLLVTRERLGT